MTVFNFPALRNTLIAKLPRPPERLVPPSSPWRSFRGFLVYEVAGTMYKVADCEKNPNLMLKVLIAYRRETEKTRR